MKRGEAIARIREELVRMTDPEHSMCQVAAERGIFCNGFRRFSEKELRDRYWWIVRKRPNISRSELESVANEWQLARQDVNDATIACDVQAREHDTCGGWEDFSDADLETFYQQLTGEVATVA